MISGNSFPCQGLVLDGERREAMLGPVGDGIDASIQALSPLPILPTELQHAFREETIVPFL